MKLRLLLPALAIVCGLASTALSRAEAEVVPSEVTAASPLRVGAAGSQPFVAIEGNRIDGLSVSVWRAVARRAAADFELVHRDNVGVALQELAADKLDVVIGPVSITAARAEEFAFTQPYYQASLSILAPEQGAMPWQRLAPLVSKAFAGALGVLLLILLIVGVLFWLSERRKNPDHFPASPLAGIANGMWLALVTMTTVGYGDRVPTTLAGRLIASTWMLVSLLLFSSLTAGIASSLTLIQMDSGQIERAEQLAGRRVATVKGSTSAAFSRRHGARVVPLPSLEAAVEHTLKGKADAIVFDRPALQYHLSQHPELELVLSSMKYEPQGYGFAVRPGLEQKQRLDVALLQAAEAGDLEVIVERWLGGDEL